MSTVLSNSTHSLRWRFRKQKNPWCGRWHAWNGMMLIQAPLMTGEIALECARLSRRPITGFAGPLDQVRLARMALGMRNVPSRMQSDEWLYGLDLRDLKVPAALLNGVLYYRPPRHEE